MADGSRPGPERAWVSDEERRASLCARLDAIHAQARASLGEEDVRHIHRIDRLSRRLGIAGRVLIHVSLDPVSFGAGVVALAASRQLQMFEIGHTVLHGVYDRFASTAKFHSTRFRWPAEVDEASWSRVHNFLHHGHTNIVGRDSDLQVGFARWSPLVPHRPHHRLQLTYSISYLLYWWTGMSLHTAGVLDIYARSRADCVIVSDKSLRTIWRAHRVALRRIVRHKTINYVLYPALAGPLFWKVAAGNWLADGLRDIYSAMTQYSNHIGHDVVHYPRHRRAKSRGEWYEMQIEATNNFDVPRWVSVLCGAVDRHIEHHLSPRLPPNRLREISPAVRAVCTEHGVRYRSASWPETLANSWRMLARLARRNETS